MNYDRFNRTTLNFGFIIAQNTSLTMRSLKVNRAGHCTSRFHERGHDRITTRVHASTDFCDAPLHAIMVPVTTLARAELRYTQPVCQPPDLRLAYAGILTTDVVAMHVMTVLRSW